jgi:phosphonopyruvate decarboxylase
MKIEELINTLNCDFFTWVPDSQLKALCNYLMNTYGIDKNHHIIAANEGNAVGIAAWYHLATWKIPIVYLQNSWEGNIINPVASLLNDNVYWIPSIFIIWWRWEPWIHDEPQHIYQGKVTLELLDIMDISYFIITPETTKDELSKKMDEYKILLWKGKQVAFVVKKNALTYDWTVEYKNNNLMRREEIIEHIVKYSWEDLIISTTGKTSRELFEIRERNWQSHKYDFLTVWSMWHTSSIALWVAINNPTQKVRCIDWDWSCLMHMWALAVNWNLEVNNLIHIVINNSAHESVGWMPTAVWNVNLCDVAKACWYKNTLLANNYKELELALKTAKDLNTLTFIEIKADIWSRKELW